MNSRLAGKVTRTVGWVAVLAALVGRPAVAAEPAPATGSATTILDTQSLWRCWLVARRPVVRVGGELKELGLYSYGGVWMPVEGAKGLAPVVNSAAPPADWNQPDFDDQGWTRLPGPFFPSHRGHAYCKEVEDAGYLYFEGTHPTLAAVCLRGKFMVADPASAGQLTLSVAYRGGLVAYINGQEIASGNIPEQEKARGLEALAEDYPLEAFVKPDGKAISWGFGDPQKCFDQLQKRIRRLNGVTIPPGLLRKGVNVLSLQAHRAPYHESIYGSADRGKGYLINWATVGITGVRLQAGGSGVSANVARPAGLQVWNQDPAQRVRPTDYGDPCETFRPMRLSGACNGTFTGQVVVGSPGPLRGLKAAASDLAGPGTIPASAVQIRYALPDAEAALPFEVLATAPPAEVAVDKAGGGALAPVWVSVKVPGDARPGDYKGTLTVTAEGARPVTVPVELRVAGWVMPDSREFATHVGLTQSPESVALRYKVPMWSPEHWTLIEKSFELMGQAGADDVFITAIRRTHFGNEHAMVRWVRQPDGTLRPDLGLVEKYLDLAVKHLGRAPVVCIYCWEPCTGGAYGSAREWENKGLPYSLLDPASGKLQEAEGPKWGTPEVREFLKPLFTQLGGLLAERGLAKSLMVGIAGDARPKKEAAEDLKAVAPDARWVIQSHMTGNNIHGQPVGYLADVWGSPVAPDPADKRLYGWSTPFLRTTFPREGSTTVGAVRTRSPLAQYRVALEGMITAGIHGFGRMGADFWDVLDPKDPLRNKYSGGIYNVLGRYPESSWAQLYLGNSTPYVLAPGADGPLPTARFEMIRQGAQECEARIFLEKALTDPAAAARLGPDLARRCQELLDERVRAILLGRSSWLFFAGDQERVERLYSLAGEAAARLQERLTDP